MIGTALQSARGVATLVLLCVNTVVWAVPIYTVILAKLLVPAPAWRRRCGTILDRFGSGWIACNNFLSRLLQRVRWDVAGLEGLDPQGSYLVSCNHQSWSDIPVLQKVFNGRIPFLKFFIKQELIWVPILGGVWWGMDMPFMNRHSPAEIEKRPELRKQDVEATRRACAHFLDRPVSLLNFLEGTRFTEAKHARQESPYRHLLRPKAGGAAFALAALGSKIDTLLDVTIAYPEGRPSFWTFLCGGVHHIVVRVEPVSIPDEFLTGDYEDDPDFRARFQAWVRQLWERKDATLDQLLTESVAA